MTEHEKNPDTEKPDEAMANGPSGFAHARTDSDEPGPSEEDVLLRLAKENEELKDQALRLAAEMDNLRKRTARDVHEARSYSIANFARDMLGVSDDLRRALDAVPQEAREGGDQGLKGLVEGVEMTERSMLSALERHGVKQINPQGEKFDPHFHQAMFEMPGGDAPAGTVVQVVQGGFVIGERVLRPAMVGVAKAAPKPQAEKPAGAEPDAPNPYTEKDA